MAKIKKAENTSQVPMEQWKLSCTTVCIKKCILEKMTLQNSWTAFTQAAHHVIH